jgi:uncharacterized membrane protein HdeD (DUF308 family)
MEIWSLLIVRGIVGLVVGFIAIMWPGITIAALVVVFGAYAIVDGVSNLVMGLKPAVSHERSWAQAFQGLIGIAAGVLTFLWPGITALALVFFIAAWAMMTGVLEIAAAVRLRRVITGEWRLLLSGILSMAFGIIVFAMPAAGAIGIAWMLGVYTAAAGAVLISLGVHLKSAFPSRQLSPS